MSNLIKQFGFLDEDEDNSSERIVFVRTINDNNGEPYFIAKDVALLLGYKDPKKAIDDNCFEPITYEDFLNSLRFSGKGGLAVPPIGINDLQMQTKLIREPDVYALVTRSKLKSAKRFQSWVYKEVLPQIRKTGSYSINKNNTPVTIEYLDATINQLKQDLSKASIFGIHGVKKFRSSMDMDEIAKKIILEFEGSRVFNHEILKKQLYGHLREHGFISTIGTFPTARGIKSGVVDIEVFHICYGDDEEIGKSIKTVVYEDQVGNFINSFIQQLFIEDNLKKFNILTNNNIIPKESNIDSDVNVSFDNMPKMAETSHLYEYISNAIN